MDSDPLRAIEEHVSCVRRLAAKAGKNSLAGNVRNWQGEKLGERTHESNNNVVAKEARSIVACAVLNGYTQ